MTPLTEDRRARLWRLVREIAAQPGVQRKQLAWKFCLSERQMQADLDLVRNALGLPLVRQGGYRFDEARGERRLSVTEDGDQLIVTVSTSYVATRPLVMSAVRAAA